MLGFLEDENTFTAIVHAHSSTLFVFAFRITGSKQVAEDLVQEAFLKLWQRRTEVISDNIGGWLYKVVAHSAYKYVKRESKKRQIINSLQAGKPGSYTDVEERLMD